MHVLHHVDRRFSPGERRSVQKGGQPALTRIGRDGGQRDVLVTDSEQVVEQEQILGIRVGESRADLCPGGLGAEVADAEHRPQQPRCHKVGHLASM